MPSIDVVYSRTAVTRPPTRTGTAAWATLVPFSTVVPELSRPVRAARQASGSTTGALESAPPESIQRDSCIDPSTRLTSTSVTRYPVDSDVSVTSRRTRAWGSGPPTVAANGPERWRAVVRSVDNSEPTSRFFRPGATNTYSAAIASSVIEKNISARRVLSDSRNSRGRITVWWRSRRLDAAITAHPPVRARYLGIGNRRRGP